MDSTIKAPFPSSEEAASSGPLQTASRTHPKRPRGREANIYDAVAARPEEALFRRRHAPVRYAEHDIYWASEDLRDGGRRSCLGAGCSRRCILMRGGFGMLVGTARW
ncbi:hypothetical protein N0V88_000864 [Collariella sp. IMI 366227]|nr:hypothetical protein N0V88_000864 [Collariella sp. IMI 366227]